ncbi:recombinase family protein [Vannielia litorea]|uniref:recombinase family protein n=1 Tax=Vannielia litorea TaxID=1217970 RepID=UPI001BCBE4E6|nr:recombinase family protein [Vannielia litorea]MBS8225743.1 hypothetical protein [Vannielia litorea]
MPRYFGFYWTLPVPSVDFTALPKDVDEAAGQSRTIRYQRDRVRRWVKEQKGDLAGERIFLEVAPDRGTQFVLPALDAAIVASQAARAELVLVDFAQSFGWRTHKPLHQRLTESGTPFTELDPVPIEVDGQTFDPTEHFRMWSDVQAAYRATKPERKAAIREAIGHLAVEEMTNAEIAARLNEAGIKPISAPEWTKESVRKFRKVR